MNMQVTSSGEAISGVTVLVNGDTIGNTDAAGTISYVPKSVGSIEVVASKVPYSENRTTVVVRSTAAAAAISENVTNKLALSVPSDALKNQTFLITVTGGANQTAIENASISFDDAGIGITSADGTLKYASSILGEHRITAQATGYDKAARNITVMTPIQVQSFNVSSKSAKTGQTITVKANVQNVGAFNDTRKLELLVNGNKTVDSQNVTLKPGENKTMSFSYKPTDPGTYRLSLDGQEGTVTVEKTTTNWAMIAIILVLLIAIGAGAYLYHTGELETLRKRLQKQQ
jgi:plastocyanin